MKACVITTGVLFALLALAQTARIALKNPGLALDPSFVSLSLLSAALSIRAGWICRRWER